MHLASLGAKVERKMEKQMETEMEFGSLLQFPGITSKKPKQSPKP